MQPLRGKDQTDIFAASDFLGSPAACDLRNQTLMGNPAHGGEHVYELYLAANK